MVLGFSNYSSNDAILFGASILETQNSKEICQTNDYLKRLSPNTVVI